MDNFLELLDSKFECIPADERQKLRTELLALQVELEQVLEGVKRPRLGWSGNRWGSLTSWMKFAFLILCLGIQSFTNE